MKTANTIIVFLLVCFLLVSGGCDTVHEFPGENPVDPTLVNVKVELKVNLDASFGKTGSTHITTTDITAGGEFPLVKPQDHTWRLIIEVFSFKNKTVLRREILLNTNSTDFTVRENLSLFAEKYRIVAWLDHVPKASPTDTYYNTSTGLRTILLNNLPTANSDLRDCFYGGAEIDLAPYRNQWNVNITIPVELIRPFAKYILIANDVENFIDKSKSNARGVTKSNINDYTAKIFYQGFHPVGFDAYARELNDSKTGLVYTSRLQLINPQEAIICFDYPLTSPASSDVIIGIQIFDENQNLINETGDLTIPLTRGRLTIVRSDFLTRGYSSGITINPEYDGTIDIVLPD